MADRDEGALGPRLAARRWNWAPRYVLSREAERAQLTRGSGAKGCLDGTCRPYWVPALS